MPAHTSTHKVMGKVQGCPAEGATKPVTKKKGKGY